MRGGGGASLWGIALLALACASPPPEVRQEAERDIELGFFEYIELLGPKAFAIAFDGYGSAFGMARSGFDQEMARENALARCEQDRVRMGVAAPCALYAVDDQIVWSIHDELSGFAHYPGHKALWVSGDAESHLFDSTFGFASAEEAARIAMEACRDHSTHFGYGASCRICKLDDGVACIELEEGWNDLGDDAP